MAVVSLSRPEKTLQVLPLCPSGVSFFCWGLPIANLQRSLAFVRINTECMCYRLASLISCLPAALLFLLGSFWLRSTIKNLIDFISLLFHALPAE